MPSKPISRWAVPMAIALGTRSANGGAVRTLATVFYEDAQGHEPRSEVQTDAANGRASRYGAEFSICPTQ